LHNNKPVTKPQSTTQDVIGRRGRTYPRNEPLHILWRKRKCYTILCHVTWPTKVSRRQLRAGWFIRLKTDTFGHALLQHSPLQVGHRWGICLKRGIPFHHSWNGVVTKEKLQAIFKIWN